MKTYHDPELGPLPVCPTCKGVLVTGDPHECKPPPRRLASCLLTIAACTAGVWACAYYAFTH